MAIYDIDGNEIVSAYDVDGTEIDTAYDVDGSEVFSPSEPEPKPVFNPYSINNVAEYLRQPTLAMESEINQLSTDWTNFVFITDPHGKANKQHSQAVALYLLSNVANISRIVLNGDYVDDAWYQTEYDIFMQPFLDSDCIERTYATVGNHDHGHEQQIYDDFLADKTDIIGSAEDCYYYVDIPTKKLRLMFVNTSNGSAYLGVSTDELTWIQQNVVLPSTDWHLCVIGHSNPNSLGGITTMNMSGASDFISAVNQCNGHIVGYFCGHQHIDDTRLISGGFQQTTLLCDRFENTNYYDGLSVTNRVEGTANEQAISIISINTKTRNVVVRRIGAGWESIVNSLHYSY
ncbi:MAG: metallophosphoesterase [Solobacterium sp.]|nr:metallophosphoesterase [Solobacterium sp.]